MCVGGGNKNSSLVVIIGAGGWVRGVKKSVCKQNNKKNRGKAHWPVGWSERQIKK